MPDQLRHPVPDPPVPTRYQLTSPRGAKLATRIWTPKGWSAPPAPKALLLIVHGLGWHSGYYEQIATYLASTLGIYVAAYDQPGCGCSDREPGAPPGCTHWWSFDDLVEDVFAALEWATLEMRDEFPHALASTPIFLLGESFGSLQVMKATLDARQNGVERIAGVISLAGLLRIADDRMPRPLVVTILCWLSRYYANAKLPRMDTESTFDLAFGDGEWAKTARQDPKVKLDSQPTLAAAASFFSCGDEIMNRANQFPVPFLAVHGKYDARAKFEAMQEFVDRTGPKARMLEVRNTAGHHLLQDLPDVTDQVIKDVGTWIDEQLGGGLR